MADNIGDALIGALEEAVAYARGGLPATRVDRVEITARNTTVAPPPAYSPEEIRAIRQRLAVSQAVFAEMLNASASTVRAWEQGARVPDGPSLRLLQVAELHPEALSEAVSGRRVHEYRQQHGWPRVLMAAERPLHPYGAPRPDAHPGSDPDPQR